MNQITKLFVLIITLTIISNGSVQTSEIVDTLKHLNYENILQNVSPDNEFDLCRNHLQFMSTNLTNEKIMHMFDSSTKIPESVLMGLLMHLGNFDECVEVHDVENEFGPFNGKHCLASISMGLSARSIETFPDVTLLKTAIMRADNQPSNLERGAIGDDAIGAGELGFLLSYCIPSTCSGQDFQNVVNSFLVNLNLSIAIAVPEEMCNTSERKELATEDWITVAILIIIAGLAVGGTAYDLLKSGPKHKLLTAFSWYSNGKKLLSTETSGDTLQALHGIRFLSMCWVVMGHRYGLAVIMPSTNAIVMMDMFKDFWRLYITNATLSVDTFYFLSGLLVSYIFLKQMNKKKVSFNVPLYYLHRYIRLTPPYALMILLQATLLRYVSSGPLFNIAIDAFADNCQKNWWTNLLYVNNYVESETMCLGQSWYLAVDMQLFLLSPIILYPLWKWPRKWSISLLMVLIFGGLVTAFTVSFVEKLPATSLAGDPDFQPMQYLPTHARFTPWLIGIGFGCLFYETKRTDKKLSKVMVFMGWILGTAALLTALLAVYPFYNNIGATYEKPTEFLPNFEASLYTTFSRSVWVLGVGWVAYACVFGYGGPVNTFLSWKVFQPLSRLTYTIYLVHMSYQWIEAVSIRTPGYFTDLTTIPHVISDVVVSSVFAAVLSLCVESPTIILEKQLLEGSGNSTKNQKTQAGNESNIGDKVNLKTDLQEVTTQIPSAIIQKQKLSEPADEEITVSEHSNTAFVDERTIC